MSNIFREAKQLLDKKDAGSELTEEELELVSSATALVANETPKAFPDDEMLISSVLEKLARMVEEGPVAASRRRAEVARRCHKPKVVGSSPTAAIPERMLRRRA